MSIKLKNSLDEEFLTELINFIGSNHGTSHVMTNKIMLDYFFFDKNKKAYNLVVAFSNDVIVGILGYIPTTFRWSDGKSKNLEGVWTSHWTVDKYHRNGVGILLMRRLQELYPLVAGQGANQLNKKIVTKMGHHFLDHMTRTVKIYNWPLLTKIFPNNNFTELKPYEDQINILPEEQDRNATLIRYKPTISNFQPNWNSYNNYKYGTKKSFEYIKYKYIDHPVFRYEFLLTGKKNLPILIVYRLEITSGRAKFKCIRIVDVIYPELKDTKFYLNILFEKLDTIAKKNNVVFADFFCTNENIQNEMKNFGFIKEKKHNLPNLLNPVVDIHNDQNLEVYFNTKNTINWQKTYFTKSDGDQDRPNAVNLINAASKINETLNLK